MNPPIHYIPNFIPTSQADKIFQVLNEELAWVRRDKVPREEYYCNRFPEPYVYGQGQGERWYEPQPFHPLLEEITQLAEAELGTVLEACVCNRYDPKGQIFWHADDSEEMDDLRPIPTISFGAKREIWFRPIQEPIYRGEPFKLLLEHGSMCVMPPGMQDTWQHRIPRAGALDRKFETRISATLRGYISGTHKGVVHA